MVQSIRNVTVGIRLLLSFCAMIVLTGLIGVSGYFSTRDIQNRLDDIFSVRLPSMDYLIEADRDLQQLLVAERSMIFAGVDSDIFKSLVQDYEENLKQAAMRWEKFKALPHVPEEEEFIARFEKARDEWQAVSRKVVEGRLSDTREGRRLALDLTLGPAREKFEAMRDCLDQLTGIQLEVAKLAHHEAWRTYRQGLMLFAGITGFAMLTGIFLIWYLGRGISRPLRTMAAGLAESSEQLASASGQISQASQQVAGGASEQAASLEETSSALEELSSMTRQNAENASQANALMQEANQVMDEAGDSMNHLTSSMERISRTSEETQKIIRTIDEIAFQTNLLALNAAVEAARAGEAGAGFAVVADEVRNLALRAAEAAKNTASLIESSVKEIQEGSGVVAITREGFQKMEEATRKIKGLVEEVAAFSREQAQGIERINTAIAEMDKMTQQNAANAEESASASEEMNAQAEQMKTYVADLKGLVGGEGGG